MRLRQLAADAALGNYLRFLAVLVDAQHATLASLAVTRPAAAQLKAAREQGMPPIPPAAWLRDAAWSATLAALCEAVVAQRDFPAGVGETVARIRRASPDWLEDQADALLQAGAGVIDTAAAPMIMAALQVHGVALAASLSPAAVHPLDVPDLCPLCGSPPVASIVCALPPYQGYRYLHCALCAAEWHRVRVHCTLCGASGKGIAYQSVTIAGTEENEGDALEAAVRAETCDDCHGYRKILYQEKDAEVEPVADDLASLNLDLLLGQRGYHRGSGNPLLWQPD